MATPRTTSQWVSPTEIRHAFSMAMSQVYQEEVPLYAQLLSLVSDVNDIFFAANPSVLEHMQRTGQLERLHYERHGAVRLGTAEEMKTMARFFAVMGMQPVGYYDLTEPPARLPIHSTCFRCLDLESLTVNPFRVFVSLLRPEYISESQRAKTFEILSRRQIFSAQCIDLIEAAEAHGGLDHEHAREFIREGLETFKWRGTATVTHSEYQDLKAESPLLADIVAFPGPHINHLTPRTLDIDQVQIQMENHGIPMKDVIEGPPFRKCPILLRQTSFKALSEKVLFPSRILGDNSDQSLFLSRHTARFGEIEQRGAALTEKGRALYDHLVNEAWKKGVTPQDPEAYRDSFLSFPDDWKELRKNGLVWFRYYVVNDTVRDRERNVEDLISAGKIAFTPLVYEDFLPLSAAGIFRSNLTTSPTNDGTDHPALHDGPGRDDLQRAIGKDITSEFWIYEKLQEESLETCRQHFGIQQPRLA
jgi:uncharacterized glyoxalase superfamily metalloenzyme YdcJ